MERPALRRLMQDVEQGKVDVIVVYKIDRLTRSLIDFSQLIVVLEKMNVSFVSVTQEFNTTNSMGRLMLNVLLSFAQFEREVTAEHIRDKLGGLLQTAKPIILREYWSRATITQCVFNEMDSHRNKSIDHKLSFGLPKKLSQDGPLESSGRGRCFLISTAA